jgi:RNA polymerase sigma-70 factor (ECF subfamily)
VREDPIRVDAGNDAEAAHLCHPVTHGHGRERPKPFASNARITGTLIASASAGGTTVSAKPSAWGSANDLEAGPSPVRERELVGRCLRGDAAAWEAVVASHGRRIGRLAYRYVPLRGEVEDLKQEVFLRVYCGLATFRADTGNLSGWIVRVARNLIVDHLRKNRNLPKCRDGEEFEMHDLLDTEIASPERNTAQNEESRILQRSLRLLTPELEQALVLKYLKQMSYKEIASRLGIPDGTVKSRVKRGREKLAYHLSRQGLNGR